MTLQQLINQFRIEAFDNVAPYLFTDPELVMWFNEAEVEAAIRAQLLRETSNPLLVQFDIKSRQMVYPLDPRMLEIDYASLIFIGASGMLPYPLALTSSAEMDGCMPLWRTLPFRPSGIIHYDTTLSTNSLPDTDYTIRTEGYRLPIASMALEATAEVLATGTVTLASGTGGTVATATVNGTDILGSAVSFNGTLGQTATDVAAQINLFQNKYTAAALGAVVTITDIATAGSLHNGWVVATTLTGTLTTTVTAMTGGVDAVVTAPELNGAHHRHLVKWALHRGYEKPDAETFDPAKSARALAEFEDYFGVRPDASNRKRANASRPHRNVAYA